MLRSGAKLLRASHNSSYLITSESNIESLSPTDMYSPFFLSLIWDLATSGGFQSRYPHLEELRHQDFTWLNITWEPSTSGFLSLCLGKSAPSRGACSTWTMLEDDGVEGDSSLLKVDIQKMTKLVWVCECRGLFAERVKFRSGNFNLTWSARTSSIPNAIKSNNT